MKKYIELINKSQEEMKNTISEMKNTVEGIKIRRDEAENQVSKLEDKVENNFHTEQQNEKSQKEQRGVKGAVGKRET